MKKHLFLTLIVLLLFISTANATPYFIGGVSSDDKVFIKDNFTIGTNAYMIEKTGSYSPDGENVFVLFDDFEDGTIDTSKWVTSSIYESEVNELNGYAEVYGHQVSNHQQAAALTSVDEFEYPLVIESQMAVDYSKGSRYGKIGTRSQTSISYSSHGTMYYSVFSNSDSFGNAFSVGTSTFGNTGYELTENEWYPSTFQIADEDSYFTVNGEKIEDTSTEISETSGYISMYGTLWNYEWWKIRADWLGVRKYTSSEPVVNVTDVGSYYLVEVTSEEELTDYQLGIPATELNITSTTESLQFTKILDPYVIITIVSPKDNNYTNSSYFSFEIEGFGDYDSAIYIDDDEVWSGAVSAGENQLNFNLTQGSHEWYINTTATFDGDSDSNVSTTEYFIFDSISPSAAAATITPNNAKIANSTIVDIDVEWTDVNLKNAEFYVDYGSGYVLEDSISFSNTTEVFETEIDTSGYTGENISWYQICYDEAGNEYTYSDSFDVIIDKLQIYVYDETTGEPISPEQVKIYNDYESYFATISGNNTTLSYNYIDTGKYIVSVSADTYYSRNSIIDVDITLLSELNMYLISENETVIYDTFKINDMSASEYDYDDYIIRLDKPISDGVETVFSSYFDFVGTTSTHLIANDQYILHIVTPDNTISYGWLTPDADGEIEITIGEYELSTEEEWLSYSYDESDTSVSFEYESAKSISEASMTISLDGINQYNVSSATSSGSFIYNSFSENGTYFISISVESEDGYTFTKQNYVEIGEVNQVDLFPESYTLLMKSIVVTLIMIVGALVISSYRADISALWVGGIYSLSVYQNWMYGNAITVAIIGILALGALVKFHRREKRM